MAESTASCAGIVQPAPPGAFHDHRHHTTASSVNQFPLPDGKVAARPVPLRVAPASETPINTATFGAHLLQLRHLHRLFLKSAFSCQNLFHPTGESEAGIKLLVAKTTPIKPARLFLKTDPGG